MALKKPLFFLIFFSVLGISLSRVFSLNLVRQSVLSDPIELEEDLLITKNQDILPGPQARKVMRGLEPLVSKLHKVERNEWLEKIAKEFGVPAIYIRSTNDLEDPQLRPAQEIWVQNKGGMVHVARTEVPLETVIKNYEKLGARREKILSHNPIDEVTIIKEGQVYVKVGSKLWIPDARRSYPYLSRPVYWSRISSQYGMRRHPLLKVKRWHDGYDLVASHGAPIYAGQEGVVVYAGEHGGYGNVVDVRHSKITTRYGHLSKVLVQVGQKVKRKQLIGRVGSTGLSSGPHLHFEVHRNSDGRSVRPGKYLY